MKISIVIPTKNRVEFLRESVKTTLDIDRDNVEIVVSDNASTDTTKDEMLSINDPRVNYVNTGKAVSMRANFENGLAHSTGDYIIFFGDDDGILPQQITALLTVLEREQPDVLKWPMIRYGWPLKGHPKTGGMRLRKTATFGATSRIDNISLVNKLLSCEALWDEKVPAIYHGVASRSYIEKLKGNGILFNCTIPDIYFSNLAIFEGGKHLFCNHPFSINGYGKASNGGAQAKMSEKKVTNEIVEQFAADNALDQNMDVANFGPSIGVTFFLAMETARVAIGREGNDVDYVKWFASALKSANTMPIEKREHLFTSLGEYAEKIGKQKQLEAAKKVSSKSDALKKLKRKLSENLDKFGSIRFTCEIAGENTIYTASQQVDKLLANEFVSIYDKTKSKNEAWSSLKKRFKSI